MELIKIIEREGRQLVSGRELHEFLEIGTKYKDWFPRMVEYGFEEGIDFIIEWSLIVQVSKTEW